MHGCSAHRGSLAIACARRASASPPSLADLPPRPPTPPQTAPRGLRPRHFFARRAGMGMPARPALLLLLLAGAHARALELGRVLHLAGDEMDSRHARHCSTLFL